MAGNSQQGPPEGPPVTLARHKSFPFLPRRVSMPAALKLRTPPLKRVKQRAKRVYVLLPESCPELGLWSLKIKEKATPESQEVVEYYQIQDITHCLTDRSNRTFLVRKDDERGKMQALYTCTPGEQRCECQGRGHSYLCRHLAMLAAMAERGHL